MCSTLKSSLPGWELVSLVRRRGTKQIAKLGSGVPREPPTEQGSVKSATMARCRPPIAIIAFLLRSSVMPPGSITIRIKLPRHRGSARRARQHCRLRVDPALVLQVRSCLWPVDQTQAGRYGDTRYIDETFVKIRGRHHCLRRAIDQVHMVEKNANWACFSPAENCHPSYGLSRRVIAILLWEDCPKFTSSTESNRSSLPPANRIFGGVRRSAAVEQAVPIGRLPDDQPTQVLL